MAGAHFFADSPFLARPDAQSLGQALAYWQAHFTQGLLAFSSPAPSLQACLQDQSGQPALWVCAGRPLVGLVRRRFSQDFHGSQATRLPQVTEIADLVDDQIVRRARHGQDVPRSVWVRQSELAWAIERSDWLRKLVAPTSTSAMSLAADWVHLFERWDWLLMAWRLLGEPRPSSGHENDPSEGVLTGLQPLVLLYLAQYSAEDVVPWLVARSPEAGAARPSLFREQRMLSLGPADLLPQAQWVVLGGQLPQLVQFDWATLKSKEAAQDAQLVWPELADLSEGRLPDPQGWPSLLARRERLSQTHWRVWAQQLTWHETLTLEASAQAASRFIAQALEGEGRVAVVAADRLAARRLNALLSAQGVALHDPAGWTLDTTVAASVVLGLLDLLSGQASKASVLNWLSMPLVQRGLAQQGLCSPEDQTHLYRRLRGLQQPTDQALLACLPTPLLERLNQAAAARQGGRLTTISHFLRLLEDLGLWSSLSQDPAGLAMLAALQTLAVAMPADDELPQSTLRSLVLRSLSESTMPLPADAARVHLVGLAEAAYGDFQSTVLLGVAEGQFPSRAPSRLMARGEMRAARGEWPDSVEQAQTVGLLSALLAHGQRICLVAQREEPDQRARWASPLARLAALLQPSLEPWLGAQSSSEASEATHVSVSPMPRLTLQRLPEQISVSHLPSLAKCPYQFYWRSVLGLDLMESLEAPTDARDLGSLLHQILAEGHRAPAAVQSDAQALAEWFVSVLKAHPHHAGLPASLRADLVGRLRQAADWWAGQLPAYQVAAVEKPGQVRLSKSGVVLKGRLDRLDQWTTESGAKAWRVLDYKTGADSTINQRRKTDYADLQLLAYAQMVRDQTVSTVSLGYLSVGASKVVLVSVESDQDLLDQADQSLARLAQQQAPVLPLAAFGQAKACSDCMARHGCRSRDWAGQQSDEGVQP